jgi:hypothetical protein
MNLNKYSFGIGDRFGMQGMAQLRAIKKAEDDGIHITPVWNKSNREHTIIHTSPSDTRKAADLAVKLSKWNEPYFVDADHINLSNVDPFIEPCDFFTIDISDFIGAPVDEKSLNAFALKNQRFIGSLSLKGIDTPIVINEEIIRRTGIRFLAAVKNAGLIYQHILRMKNGKDLIIEVSMDEVKEAQSPVELLLILSALSDEKIPVQTIAPKFTGRFNKGVDYVGDIKAFEKEFEEDLLIIDFAIKEFNLPADLKISVHSGSDKFSLYPVIGNLIRKHDKGIHIKTAGTTWLEEMIGLSMADEDSLDLAKSIYSIALKRINELTKPYSSVIDIDINQLPSSLEILRWSNDQFSHAIRHNPAHPEYNPHMRQLLHVSYKVAVEYGIIFTDALKQHTEIIGEQVTENLYERHIKRLFENRN